MRAALRFGDVDVDGFVGMRAGVFLTHSINKREDITTMKFTTHHRNPKIVHGTSPNEGFTLVELLIVIVILGILATVTVFAVRGITDKGQTSACAADKKTIESAVEAYFAQYSGATIAVSPAAAPAGATWTTRATPDDTLVSAGLLRSVSTKYTTSADGATLTPVVGSNCP